MTNKGNVNGRCERKERGKEKNVWGRRVCNRIKGRERKRKKKIGCRKEDRRPRKQW